MTGPPETQLMDGATCACKQEEPDKRRCPGVILGNSSLKSILLQQQQSCCTDSVPGLQHLFCCCFFQQVPGYLGSHFFFRKPQNRMSNCCIISWSGEISPHKALPAPPVPNIETKIKLHSCPSKSFKPKKEGLKWCDKSIMKWIMFTHPPYSTLGTVAASRLGTPSRSLAPLPLALINTKYFLRG